ncbi:MAG: hypothetical protein HY070_01025, partial [Chloroflexi bacterium]|nr:hypothetical protein [Chloroflexota bacterium]
NYTVFIHLLDVRGNIRAQIDTQPFAGSYPTSLWDAGEIVRDEYALELPRDLAPGDYKIELGFYEYPSLARLPVTHANGESIGNQLILDSAIRIESGAP